MQFHPSEADIGTVIQLGGGGAVAARRTAAVEPPDADDDPATTARLVGLHDLFEGPGKQDVVAAEESEQFPLCGERALVDRVEDPVSLPVMTVQPRCRANSSVPSVLPPSTTCARRRCSRSAGS
jgi:hypothetical protein